MEGNKWRKGDRPRDRTAQGATIIFHGDSMQSRSGICQIILPFRASGPTEKEEKKDAASP